MSPPVNETPSRYAQEGYCLYRNVVSAQEVDEARAELDRLIADMPDRMTVYKDGHNREVAARPEYLTEPHSRHAFWLELCRHPRVLDAVESVLGDNLILLMSHLIVKRPDDGLPVAWHQDNTYWHSVRGTDVATVWLALDDTDRSNGCMQVIPSSHAGYPELEKISTGANDLLGLTVSVADDSLQHAVALEMTAGSLSIHDSYVLHGSQANTSGRRRAAYTMRYANARTVSVNTEEHWVPIYWVRGSNLPASEDYVDIRPGKPLP